jgi:hypothetical protein
VADCRLLIAVLYCELVGCVQAEILAEHGPMAADEATAYLKTMGQEGRYLRDVWS